MSHLDDRILLYLAEHEFSTIPQVAHALQVKRGTAKACLFTMKKQGLVNFKVVVHSPPQWFVLL